jgi:thiopurine S-methyltransferase
MQPDFWHERWRDGRIGFHQDKTAPALEKFWPNLDLPDGCSVFVPLCGKSLDMLWLRQRAHNVVGNELSDLAIETFCMENAIPAQRSNLNGFQEYRASNLSLLCGDFFQLKPSDIGSCRAVYDRAALVSWTPELRTRYVEHLAELTHGGCQTLLITVEYPQAEAAGPPFSVDAECVHRLYSAHHEIRRLHHEDILAEDPRMRARGVTQLHAACYHLTRL